MVKGVAGGAQGTGRIVDHPARKRVAVPIIASLNIIKTVTRGYNPPSPTSELHNMYPRAFCTLLVKSASWTRMISASDFASSSVCSRSQVAFMDWLQTARCAAEQGQERPHHPCLSSGSSPALSPQSQGNAYPYWAIHPA